VVQIGLLASPPGRRKIAAAANGPGSPHDLSRSAKAWEGSYERALAEIRAGRKRSHWMGSVFPRSTGVAERLHFSGVGEGRTLRLLGVAPEVVLARRCQEARLPAVANGPVHEQLMQARQ
jgi:hypothetical protein